MRFAKSALAALCMLLLSCSSREPLSAHWAQLQSGRLYYEQGGRGRTVLLLHGGGETIHSSFGKQIPLLVAGHEVIAPEQTGHGHTPDSGKPLRYAAMLDDTVALLDQLKVGKVDVIGWSDGAILALMLAAQHPERVRRVVAAGANVTPDGLTAEDMADTRAQYASASQDDPSSFGTRLLKMWMESPTPSEISFDALRKVDKPVLVLVGDHDAIREEHTLAIYRALPKGQLLILPDTGHAVFATRADWLNPVLLDFIDGEE